MRPFFLLLIGVIAAMVLLALILIGGLCGWMCDMADRCVRWIDRCVKYWMAPLK